MAKDVDLSSKEWTDIIFDGKNKEFGAYQLRRNSDKRHNRAVLATLIGLIVILVGAYFLGSTRQSFRLSSSSSWLRWSKKFPKKRLPKRKFRP